MFAGIATTVGRAETSSTMAHECSSSDPGGQHVSSNAYEPAMVVGKGCGNDKFEQFFSRYHVAEIIRGYELAQDEEFFKIARSYRKFDLRLLLKFVEDDVLDILEELKFLRESDVLRLSETTLKPSNRASHQSSILRHSHGMHSHRLSSSSRDSGYGSRPSSEVESSMLSLQERSCHISPLIPGNFQDDPLKRSSPAAPSFSSPQHLSESYNQPFSSTSVPQSPYTLSSESTPSGHLESSKLSRTRKYECMYCTQDFVRYGDCLNHEENNHSQRKEWICPHCQVRTKTKAGYDRHHKNHGCRQCDLKERVAVLSGPKTACACPYCAKLFEGLDCFASRAIHSKKVHFKSVNAKTRIDLDHSGMIQSLLQRQELAEPWRQFRESKSSVRLDWTPDNARELVEDLEFGDYPCGIDGILERVYDLAEKFQLPLDQATSTTDRSESKQEALLKSPKSHSSKVSDHFSSKSFLGRQGPDSMNIGVEHPGVHAGINLRTHDPMVAERTRRLLSTPFQGNLETHVGTNRQNLIREIHGSNEPRQCSPAKLRQNVFMGYGKASNDSLDAMEIAEMSDDPAFSNVSRSLTTSSQGWAFGDLDDSLIRMEGIMAQQILSSPQLDTSTYTPPAWDDALPPSLRSAAASPPPPPCVPLPRFPQRRAPSTQFRDFANPSDRP
ncbi:hypothetical protein CC78DRAFT_112267 [Lojkania enalia]|uniref:C2H2-type domain-containing protein n=1 Tax=Lojkania enalia TaxID=147567 RepID=A0A9P4N5E1_9PLEO|nr:hypothetical protein CC78DRAFT_112267 [Didymosphaeria enalia]